MPLKGYVLYIYLSPDQAYVGGDIGDIGGLRLSRSMVCR
jgi:hypothetical protein